jgi:putative transcriptional regulator
MRGFDQSCLTPVAPLTPHEIRIPRECEPVSQTAFANYLNATPNLTSTWERSEKKPSGPALKLLSLVERHSLTAVAQAARPRSPQAWAQAMGRPPRALVVTTDSGVLLLAVLR